MHHPGFGTSHHFTTTTMTFNEHLLSTVGQHYSKYLTHLILKQPYEMSVIIIYFIFITIIIFPIYKYGNERRLISLWYLRELHNRVGV